MAWKYRPTPRKTLPEPVETMERVVLAEVAGHAPEVLHVLHSTASGEAAADGGPLDRIPGRALAAVVRQRAIRVRLSAGRRLGTRRCSETRRRRVRPEAGNGGIWQLTRARRIAGLYRCFRKRSGPFELARVHGAVRESSVHLLGVPQQIGAHDGQSFAEGTEVLGPQEETPVRPPAPHQPKAVRQASCAGSSVASSAISLALMAGRSAAAASASSKVDLPVPFSPTRILTGVSNAISVSDRTRARPNG